MFLPNPAGKKVLGLIGAIAVALCLSPLAAPAQSQPSDSQAPAGQQQAPPEAGGPQGDTGSIALPKKKEEPPPERKPEVKNPAGMPDYSLRVDVPLVQVPVLVTTKDGQFIPGLKEGNFRVLEDGVPQRVTKMTQSSDAPVTAVLLVEFAATSWKFMYDSLNASYTFANTLKPDDWIAVIYYDIKPHMLTDFTRDKRAVYGALAQLRIPMSREVCTWDALYDTLDRLEGVEGRKYVVLVGSGIDTFSKVRYDQILKKVKGSRNVTIFAISTGRAVREMVDAYANRSLDMTVANMDFLQAENAMKSIAGMTGGRSYYPRFEGEMPEIFRDIGESIRNQYTLAYKPTNTKQDGTFRKVKVEIVGPDGQPLVIHDQKGKTLKYQVVAREGYNAKHEVE